MFRRKGEDSLFDTNTDQADAATSATDTSSSTATTTSSSATAASAPASTTTTAAPAATAGSTFTSSPMPRNNPTPAASGFRASTSAMGGDMPRNRMPETKVGTTSVGAGIEKSNKSGRRVLTVGNDILLKGEIATCDRLVIEGKVDATLNDVHTVEIAETGSFKGSANIEDAEISGLFEGDLVVRNRLVIYATGKVRGKISYGEIEIERGGEMTGEIKTTNPQSTTAGPRPTRKVDDKVAA